MIQSNYHTKKQRRTINAQGFVKLVLLIVALLIIVSLTVYYLLRTQMQPQQIPEQQNKIEEGLEQQSNIVNPSLPTRSIEGYDGARKADLNSLAFSIRTYYREMGSYPSSLDLLIPIYASYIPNDPKTGESYKYTFTDKSFKICAMLEAEMPSEKCMTN